MAFAVSLRAQRTICQLYLAECGSIARSSRGTYVPTPTIGRSITTRDSASGRKTVRLSDPRHLCIRSSSDGAPEGMEYEWSFSDGTKATGARVSHVFPQAGRYRPTLKVTDAKGNVDYDFGKVTVADPDIPSLQRCYLHASYWPTKEIDVGDEVAFFVRSFRFVPPQGEEIWDFGDGSPSAHSQSDGAVDHHRKDGYGTVTHCFKEPGHYVVTVRRSNSDGQWAVDKIDVRVERQREAALFTAFRRTSLLAASGLSM
jgi:PKD repeat protein